MWAQMLNVVQDHAQMNREDSITAFCYSLFVQSDHRDPCTAYLSSSGKKGEQRVKEFDKGQSLWFLV